MEVILTHDFADFDAVAALVAAHKLIPAAYPIRPNRINGNVQRFLDDYGGGMQLVEMRDVPQDKITRVVLVDMQQLPGLRRLSDEVSVRVIDHHPLDRAGLNPAWDVLIEEVGATVTLLVEQLQTTSASLSEAEATLLMLGIFEDTGSLLYGMSTPRDARAVAWLMEQGAAPDIVRKYLHEPLDAEQRELFEALLANAEAHEVAGHVVMLAYADAPELSSSIAPLAHHLGDALEADVLLMLIGLKKHVQLVARSGVEEVDVGLLARELGGGGHRRASAARLLDAEAGVNAEAARQMVLDALHAVALPGVKVADVMSHGVLTLPADSTAAEAAKQIRRYGYEGYPVVDGDRLVGLLTRRAVDRAMSHNLAGIRLREIMAAGSVTVSPEDSIHHVQQVMLDSGWGQLPVVNGGGEITGVVTRTDLIKDWGRGGRSDVAQPVPQELMRMLGEAWSPPLMALVRHTGRVAQELRFSLYVVGGPVRDLLLDQPKADIDFVVEGDAIELVRHLKMELGGEMRTHGRFGTAKWLLDATVWERVGGDQPAADLPVTIDFATARTEFYAYPSALPEVERSSIKMDLHRRDFSINALALQLDLGHEGRLLDFWGGLRDLEKGVIRVLHSLSFIDDPTRMLRAVRLEQRLGFTIAERTQELIKVALPMLDRVSGDRIRHEIEAIFAEARPEDALARLQELGILAVIQPGVEVGGELAALMATLREAATRPLWPELAQLPNLEVPYFTLLTRQLSEEQARRAGKRLKIQRRSVEDVLAARALLNALPQLQELEKPSAIHALLRPYNDRALLVGWTLAAEQARAHIERYAHEWRHVQPVTDGQKLKTLGLPPGPEFRVILDRLRAAWLDGEVSGAAEEEALLQTLLAEGPRSQSAGN